MAMSHNYVCAMGYLGADPEIRKLDRGGEVASFSLAATERWGSGQEQHEHTEWFRCQVFAEKLVEVVDKFLKKGDPAMIEGKLRTRKWTDKDGVERYSPEIIINRIQLVGSAPAGNGADRGANGYDTRNGNGGRADDRGRGRDDRGGGRDERRTGGRDDDRRGNGRDDDRRAATRDAPRDAGRTGGGRPAQHDRDLDDEIPF